TLARSHGNASRDAFEQALGCAVRDEFSLYQEAEERSKRRCGLQAAATSAQKAALSKLSPEMVSASTLAGDPITARLTAAPGNG
ncbi:hypothetical protein ONQ60_28320, partial [Salmonella enterica subsp. enterica serovar Virginia]|nr:hypothetical protein [Salmonella enterica subsp. enterica serovar Virginia]